MACRCEAQEAELMRLSLRDPQGKELAFVSIPNPKRAPYAAMQMLSRLEQLEAGSLLIFDDDQPVQGPDFVTITADNLRSIGGRLEARAKVFETACPEDAADMRIAARLCRHFLKVGWIGKSSVAI
jgi:hypothetical protein